MNEFRLYFMRFKIRPWALAAPILVLIIALPLLRPIRHPLWSQISDEELATLATVQSIVEQHTLAIDHSMFTPIHHTIHANHHEYSDESPVFAALLAGPYAVMRKLGLTLAKNQTLVTYLLTLVGVSLPVAAAAGFVYRMGRLFELSRPMRSGLAAAVILGTGLISYAVVLNPHAPAAAAVLASAASLVHVTISRRKKPIATWMVAAGFCAALAAAIEPSAIIFVPLLACVIVAMRLPWRKRSLGVALYALGIVPIFAMHTAMNSRITGDALPAAMDSQFAARASLDAADDGDEVSRLGMIEHGIGRIIESFVGERGVLSHFPVLIIALIGVAAVMHRHWPATSKTLACAAVAGAAGIVLAHAVGGPAAALRSAAAWGFADPRVIVCLPIVMLWAGAWMRKKHHPATWSVAGIFLAFSIGVSLIGMTDPQPRGGYEGYTAAAAVKHLLHDQREVEPAILARQ